MNFVYLFCAIVWAIILGLNIFTLRNYSKIPSLRKMMLPQGIMAGISALLVIIYSILSVLGGK